MKWPGWLRRRKEDAPKPGPPDAQRRPLLTTDPRDTGGLTTLCPTYVIHASGFEDLRHWRQMVSARHPGTPLLASLDNVGQAGYTSFHAVETHGLDRTEGHDLSALPEQCFEEGAHIGALSQPEEFSIRLANFQSGLSAAPVRGKRLGWRDHNEDVTIDQVNFDPDAVVHAPGIVQAVPVERDADMIAAFPNGYFTVDLTPFELHMVATDLEKIGYKLIALGASYVAFWAEALLDDAQVALRSQIVAGLYHDADIDALNESVEGARHLILRYTD